MTYLPSLTRDSPRPFPYQANERQIHRTTSIRQNRTLRTDTSPTREQNNTPKKNSRKGPIIAPPRAILHIHSEHTYALLLQLEERAVACDGSHHWPWHGLIALSLPLPLSFLAGFTYNTYHTYIRSIRLSIVVYPLKRLGESADSRTWPESGTKPGGKRPRRFRQKRRGISMQIG